MPLLQPPMSRQLHSRGLWPSSFGALPAAPELNGLPPPHPPPLPLQEQQLSRFYAQHLQPEAGSPAPVFPWPLPHAAESAASMAPASLQHAMTLQAARSAAQLRAHALPAPHSSIAASAMQPPPARGYAMAAAGPPMLHRAQPLHASDLSHMAPAALHESWPFAQCGPSEHYDARCPPTRPMQGAFVPVTGMSLSGTATKQLALFPFSAAASCHKHLDVHMTMLHGDEGWRLCQYSQHHANFYTTLQQLPDIASTAGTLGSARLPSVASWPASGTFPANQQPAGAANPQQQVMRSLHAVGLQRWGVEQHPASTAGFCRGVAVHIVSLGAPRAECGSV